MKKNNRLSIYTFLMVMVIIIYFDYFGLSLRLAMAAGDTVVIGLNYPETGPYAKQGLDQRRAADLAVVGINAAACDQKGVL